MYQWIANPLKKCQVSQFRDFLKSIADHFISREVFFTP